VGMRYIIEQVVWSKSSSLHLAKHTNITPIYKDNLNRNHLQK